MSVKLIDNCMNYNFDYMIILTESGDFQILDRDTVIKKDSEYVNDYLGIEDATEDNVTSYGNLPIYNTLKADLKKMAEETCEKIKNNFRDKIEYTKVVSSDKTGISTYVTVKFRFPERTDSDVREHLVNNSKFLDWYKSGKNGINNGMGGEYKLDFRISTHNLDDTPYNVSINANPKTYEDIEKIIFKYVRERYAYIKKAWNEYKKTGELPEGQLQRNQDRKAAENANKPQWKELFKHIKLCVAKSLKESFGGTRLKSIVELEAENVLQYLDMSNIKLEDIVNAIEVEFADEPIIYSKLLAICAECLVENVIEYTFDGGFDYQLLFDDIRARM